MYGPKENNTNYDGRTIGLKRKSKKANLKEFLGLGLKFLRFNSGKQRNEVENK